MRRAAAWAGLLACLSALGGYTILIHSAVVAGQPGPATTALALLQAGIAGWTLSRLSSRGGWIALPAVAALLILSWHSARDGLLAASGIGHAAIHAGLLCLFAGTLTAGREPLVTMMARRIRGTLTGEMLVYTRRVTWAWCAFFAGQLLVSLLLFLFASDAVWSFFINVLDLPLVITMFLLEYAYRLSRFWNHSHGSITDVVRVFAEQPER